ncbi:MAG: type II toxin-antitoxin system VapC family toxin [Betaproteobacteria bacterium]
MLDTHVFLWWVTDERTLPKKAARLLAAESTVVLVSHVTVWEMAIKSALGKLVLPEAAGAFVQKHCKLNRFQLLPISLDAIAMVEVLPPHHSDPFDRLLVAECLHQKIPIVSSDSVLGKYRISRIWS